MANVLNQGKDADGKVAPMGATVDSRGNPAGNVVNDPISLYETDGTYPKTSTVEDSGDPTIPTNRFVLDVPNYTAISTPGACLAAEVAGVTFPAGSNVTGVVIVGTGEATFKGYLVTVNAGSAAAAATALSVDATAGGGANANNFDFCPADKLTRLIYDTEITDVYVTAIGHETPDNYGFIKGI